MKNSGLTTRRKTSKLDNVINRLIKTKWGILLRIASLIIIIWLIGAAYIRFLRPVEFDYTYPTLVIESPQYTNFQTQVFNSETLQLEYPQNPFYTAENPVMHVVGSFQNNGVFQTLTKGASVIVIITMIDGEISDEIQIDKEQDHFEYDVDLSGLTNGKHKIKIYAQHNVDWRYWKSNSIEFEINYRVTNVRYPIITSVTLLGKSNTYLVTGLADPNTRITFSGADLDKEQGFMLISKSYDSTGTIASESITPKIGTGLFWAYLKPNPNEALIIDTFSVPSGQKGDNPIIIESGKIGEFIANLTPIEISLKFIVSSGSIQKEFVTTAPSNNPIFISLLEDKTQLPIFGETVVGGVRLNGKIIIYSFQDALPSVRIEDNMISVRAQSRSLSSGELSPIGQSEVRIQFGSFYTPMVGIGSVNEVQITVEDYEVLSISPSPISIDENTYVWKELKPNDVIRLTVKEDLSSQITSLPNWSIYSFAGDNYLLGNFLNFSLSLLTTFFVISLLFIVSKANASDENRRRLRDRTSSMLRSTAALFMMAPLYYVLSGFVDELMYTRTWNTDFILDYFNQNTYYPFNEIMQAGNRAFFDITLLIVVLITALYVRWILNARHSFAWHVFSIISIGAFFLILLVFMAFSLRLFTGGNLDSADGQHLVLIFQSIIFSLIGYGLLANIMGLIKRYEARKIFSQIDKIKFIFVAVLIPFIARGMTSTPFRIGDGYYDLIYNTLYGLGIIADGAIYYSAFGAMMLAVLLGQKQPWEQPTNSLGRVVGILHLGERKWYGSERYWIVLGTIIFSAYVVGINDNILSLPISALLSIIVFQYLLTSPEKLAQMAFQAERVYINRKQLLNQLADDLALSRLRNKLEQLLVNLSSGKLSPSEYDQSVTLLQNEIAHIENDRVIKDIFANDFVLAFGPEKRPLDNAFRGASWAFFLQIPLLILLFNGGVLDRTEFPWLSLLVGVFIFIMRWVMTGFFFGLFYEYIRGNNGIRKALTITLGILISTLPYRLLRSSTSLSSIQTLILEMSLTVVFLLLLGAMFDRETLRKHGFTTSYLKVVTSDFTSLAYVSSLLVPVVAVIIPTIITGQFGEIVSAIVKDVIPAMTTVPLPR